MKNTKLLAEIMFFNKNITYEHKNVENELFPF